MPYRRILENNRRWVTEQTAHDPEFFRRLVGEHRPKFLWIGCSDARVPANEITQTGHGEMFVHRNVANLVVPTDVNLLAVLQYAVDVLQVEDVIVCGHERCGGVGAALGSSTAPPMVEQWLAQVRAVARLHADELTALPERERWMRLVELNAVEQVHNLARTSVVQAAWARGATLRLHGWVYDLSGGVLRDLGATLDGSAPKAALTGPPVRRTGATEAALADVPLVAAGNGLGNGPGNGPGGGTRREARRDGAGTAGA